MSVLTAYDKFMQQALKYGWLYRGPAKTGQTTKYRDGDDGDLEKGTPEAPPRFKDNGDGTITDNATGLMWVKDPTLVKKNWNDAIDYCLALNYAGHSDWRLPNINELLTILDYGTFNPAIDTIFFPNTQVGFYWSSTTRTSDSPRGWIIHLYEGDTGFYGKGSVAFVRPVRLGVPA